MSKKKNKLKITIAGSVNSGMVPILHYIGSILSTNGFKVEIASKDYDPTMHPAERMKKITELLDRETSIKLETKVAKGDLRNELM